MYQEVFYKGKDNKRKKKKMGRGCVRENEGHERVNYGKEKKKKWLIESNYITYHIRVTLSRMLKKKKK